MSIPTSNQRAIYAEREAAHQITIRHEADPIDVESNKLIDLKCREAAHVFTWLAKLPHKLSQLLAPDEFEDQQVNIFHDHMYSAWNSLKTLENEFIRDEVRYRRLGST